MGLDHCLRVGLEHGLGAVWLSVLNILTGGTLPGCGLEHCIVLVEESSRDGLEHCLGMGSEHCLVIGLQRF